VTVWKKTKTRRKKCQGTREKKEQARNRRRKHDDGKLESHEAKEKRKQAHVSRHLTTTKRS